MTYTCQLLPLNIMVYLACYTYWNTGHSYIIVMFGDPWHSHLILSILQWTYMYHCQFLRLMYVAAVIRKTQPSACKGYVHADFVGAHLINCTLFSSLNPLTQILEMQNSYQFFIKCIVTVLCSEEQCEN